MENLYHLYAAKARALGSYRGRSASDWLAMITR